MFLTGFKCHLAARMELTRENIRAMIYYDFRRGLTQQQCIDQLTSTFGDEAPSKTTVYHWFSEFNRGRSMLTDEVKAGRPKSVVVPQNIEAVRKLIMDDRHVTYREIEATLGISMTSINSILHDHLAVKKICSRWIPHNLTKEQKDARVEWCNKMLKKYNRGDSKAVYNIYTGDESWIYAYDPETKQQSTVWVFQNEPNPTKVTRAKSTLKQMVACFFGINGHVATVPLENRKTVNSDWYTTICLPEVFEQIRKTNQRRRIILHHDNASCHTSRETTLFLEGQNVELTGHPPYSPDLAPNDFYLFPNIKNKLRGQRFSTAEDAVDAFKQHVMEVPQAEWQKCFKNWFTRMQKCIDHQGEYFEKQ